MHTEFNAIDRVEADVNDLFPFTNEVPQELHEFIEAGVFYYGDQFLFGNITLDEFIGHLQDMADHQKQLEKQQLANEAILEGVKELLKQGTFNDTEFFDELEAQFPQGHESLLARFIDAQPVTTPLDAAVSFLAWKHMKAMIELEEKFGANIEVHRSMSETEFYCSSEGNMALINFSVLSH